MHVKTAQINTRSIRFRLRRGRSGVALIIVLCFVVLLTVVVLTMLSLSESNGLTSGASANFTKTDIYGHGAIDQVLGDLRQEIAAGSQVTSVYTDPVTGVVSHIYRPSTSLAAAAPALSGPNAYGSPSSPTSEWNAEFPNLLIESVYTEPFYTPGIGAGSPNRAAPVSTSSDTTRYSQSSLATGTSLNGRAITISRWNKHFLLPKQSVTITGGNGSPIVLTDSGSTDPTPKPEFLAPDWILTAADGSNPITFNAATITNPTQNGYVVGRYAFAIYNEGGLLDANAAGSPSSYGPTYPPSILSSTPPGNGRASQQILWSRKGSEAFADLTVLPGIANVSSVTPKQVSDALVGWRNESTSQASVFPATTFSALDTYFNNLLGISTRFMTAANTTAPAVSGNSDHLFTSRQQLISFLQDVANGNTGDEAYLQDAMMYLTHFSRALNQPSYYPDPGRPTVKAEPAAIPSSLGAAYTPVLGNYAFGQDNIYNPPMKSIRVQTTFTRNDGSAAIVGEPLIKKRFALSRLVWLTYKGPSGNNMTDPAVQQSIAALGGAPGNASDPAYQFVAQGTAANIKAYFGLVWTAGPGTGGIGGYWTYGIDPTSGATIHLAPARSGTPQEIARLQDVAAANREPDFFELLQAAICCGSLGTTNSTGTESATSAPGVGAPNGNMSNMVTWQAEKDYQVSLHVLQIGANMISQVSPVNFPPHIVFSNKSSTWTSANYIYSIYGSTDLPYLASLGNIAIATQRANPDAPFPVTSANSSDALTPTGKGLGVALAIPTVWDPYAASALPSNVNASFSPTALRISISNTSLDAPNANVTRTTTWYAYDWDAVGADAQIYSSGGVQWAFDGKNNSDLLNAQGEMVSTTPGTNERNNTIYFSNNNTLYREPFPLMAIQGGSAQTSTNPANLSIEASGFTASSSKNMIQLYAIGNDTDWSAGIPDLAGNKFIGFILGVYNLRQTVNPNPSVDISPKTMTATYFAPSNTGGIGVGSTISLEYQSGTAWIPYQQYDFYPSYTTYSVPYTYIPGKSDFYDEPALNSVISQQSWPVSVSPNAGGILLTTKDSTVPNTAVAAGPWVVNAICDPRTGRFSTYSNLYFTGLVYQTFASGLNGAMKTSTVMSPQTQNLVANGNALPDPDGVVRRTMGGDASGATGLPLVSQNNSSRPIMLHRPFRSVAELGYVFSDTPWKNIDFFSPESGDAALLDTFCVSDDYRPDAVSAGQVDLNGRQAPVYQALLAGAYRDEWKSITPAPPVGSGTSIASDLSNAEAVKLSQALVNRTSEQDEPLANIADLVGRYTGTANSNANNQPYDGFSIDVGASYTATGGANIQRLRETTVRALADAGQAGTWNLLIDVIAQSGRYPTSAKTLSDFLIEGERHYWVHVAIDRTTGDIVDKSIEVVNE